MIIRDAEQADIPKLTSIRDSEEEHSTRIRDAIGIRMRYLLALVEGEIVGFGILAVLQPENWPTLEKLPQIVDLFVDERHRGKGAGKELIRTMEGLAANAGFTDIFAAVDQENHSRAFTMFENLGYQMEQAQPNLVRKELPNLSPSPSGSGKCRR